MYEVTINVGANAKNYWAFLRFEDKEGKVHSREVSREREATINGNYLQAMTEAFGVLNKACMVKVRCESDYIVACFQNGWVTRWEKNGWIKPNGKPPRNLEEWKRLREKMAPHSVVFEYVKGER